jgi:RNA polymerase sigma-70 factor (ECF subfamily)
MAETTVMALHAGVEVETPEDRVGARAEAVRSLYARHATAVVARMHRLCGDAELARDLTHDAFVVAMRRLHETGDSAPPREWLQAIAYNLLRDHRRTRGRRRRLLARVFRRQQRELVGEGPDARAPLADKLEAGLEQLDDKQRDAFVLRVVEGLSLQDAATILETTVQTVSYRAQRAEAIVRAHFDKEPST